jgi:hypothetical protein
MTEAEWLACTELEDMVLHLAGTTRNKPGGASWSEPGVLKALSRRPGDRKLRLLACACARRVWAGLEAAAIPEGEKEACRRAVETAERFADGLVNKRQLAARAALARRVTYRVSADGAAPAAFLYCAGASLYDACEGTHRAAQGAAFLKAPRGTGDNKWYRAYGDEVVKQCGLLRCLVGNPFRPFTLEQAVRTPTLVSLAQAANDERLLPSGELDRVRLAVLADALEEAGAGDEALAHLRGKGPHVRGCWVVDLILDKG